ncbi:MAG: diterpene synthase [Anaerolineae bacterium]|nr:diterpene synthase [Anaerolineae bacterium]
MKLETFLNLPTAGIAGLVRAAGPKVCAFPINGTRRWFMLEHPPQPGDDPVTAYYEAISKRHVALYKMLFDHGVDTLLTPVFGPDLAERGAAYMHMATAGLSRLAKHPDFVNFYAEYGVRVRFYGDYRRFFAPPYDDLPAQFDAVTAQTAAFERRRLFFGVCAQDAYATAAELMIRYYDAHGRAPDKDALVTMYYGEPVPPPDFFIGFDKFCVFDVPLVTTGHEDLYFTVSPSLYLTERQLREILYDHCYARRSSETDYAEMTPEGWNAMGSFYRVNLGKTLGVGAKHEHLGFWYPRANVEIPASFAANP